MALVVGFPLVLAACDGAPAKAPTVDATKARDALRTVLDRWKDGAKPDDLPKGTPPITVQDFDWLKGHSLVSYELDNEGAFDDANLRVPVTLSLKDSTGRAWQQKVSYVVGTSPSITVFREMGP